jgi:hypothetical protein
MTIYLELILEKNIILKSHVIFLKNIILPIDFIYFEIMLKDFNK